MDRKNTPRMDANCMLSCLGDTRCISIASLTNDHVTRIGRCPGFTIIELVMTLVIAALVVTLGVPSLQNLIRDNRMASQANNLVTDLNLARSEAIKRGVRVTLCKSSNASTCTSDAQWESGWLAFTDPDKDGVYDGSPEQVILVSAGLKGGNTLRTGSTFSNFVSYTPTGESRGTGGNNGTFNLCDDRGTTKGRAIMINVTGRIRMEKGVSSCP